MKKVLILLVAFLVMGATIAQADLTWNSADLIAGGIPDIDENSDGWLVQMFHDQDSDTVLSSLGFLTDGTPLGTNVSDDLLLSSYTSSLSYVSAFGGSVSFSEIYGTFTELYGESVYTVILDTTGWGASTTANSTFVLDQTSHTFTSSEMQVYAPPDNNPGSHSWVGITAIPEPATMSLLALGGLGLLIRRKKQR
jgi:hypothetical protein